MAFICNSNQVKILSYERHTHKIITDYFDKKQDILTIWVSILQLRIRDLFSVYCQTLTMIGLLLLFQLFITLFSEIQLQNDRKETRFYLSL